MRSERSRRVIGAVIGTEVGAAGGLLLFGGVRFVPLLITLAGALLGAFGGEPAARLRQRLIRRALRRQLRAGPAG